MGPVDVAVLTMNSERMLRECLNSVYANVPVNNLIVVDGYSTDGTAEIVAEFQENMEMSFSFKKKEQEAAPGKPQLKLVKTDWFMFVDSDVILSKNWFAQAEKLVADDVGAVWGIEIWSVLSGHEAAGVV